MIRSMTAFSRAQATGDWGSATWELRSVNHRYLDASLRLPESLRELENKLREIMRKNLSRGKVECNLRFVPGSAVKSELLVNQQLADRLVECGKQISNHIPDAQAIDPISILRWPGVIEVSEVMLDEAKYPILTLFEEAVKGLQKEREREGSSLQEHLQKRVGGMQSEVETISKVLPDIIARQRERLLNRFNEVKIELDPERLEQEMVFLAQKIDVAEELDRLNTHIIEVKNVLAKGGAVGRRLDFLMQELNREANTIASKSISSDTTKASVELKVLIEQMREQVQNIE